jgi:hypothetical protein
MSGIGVANLNYMNDTGKLPTFATGGLVTGPSLSSMSGRYNTVSTLGSNVVGNSKSNNQSQPVSENHIHIHAFDGKSVEKRLTNGGGKKITKYFQGRAAAFEGVTI